MTDLFNCLCASCNNITYRIEKAEGQLYIICGKCNRVYGNPDFYYECVDKAIKDGDIQTWLN